MPDPTKALTSIPFNSLIGGPLDAAVQAQAKAAMTAVGFIRDVGFDAQNNVNNISFKVKKGDAETEISVPLLTVVPIPFLRIDDMTVSFKANISATQETEDKTLTSRDASVKVGASAKYLFFKANLDASYSSKKDSSSTQNSKYSVEYTVDVRVHAVQDDMPAGLARMLSILTDTIEGPAAAAGTDTGTTPKSSGGSKSPQN